MRVYRYWTRLAVPLLIDGQEHPAHFYGRSNSSMAEAEEDARSRRRIVEDRIAGRPTPPWDYNVDIREEVLRLFDDRAAVTRNRYGAEVLNANDLLMIDVDSPPRRSFIQLFTGVRGTPKERMLQHIRKAATRKAEPGLSVRIYETTKGYRVLVEGRRFDPTSRETRRWFRAFNTDRLYALMCRKQACFRARLTPKPHRLHLPSLKLLVPYTEDEAVQVADWVSCYNAASADYATCRFIQTIGNSRMDELVDLHDRMTRSDSNLPLR